MDFHCRYYESSCEWFTNAYSCQIIKISKASCGSEISFIEVHNGSKTKNDVKFLNISQQSIAAIPRTLKQDFPNMVYLTLKDCGLEKVTREDFNEYENLEYLSLSDNKLRSLPDDLFTCMLRLRALFLENNQLEHLSSWLLHPVAHTLEYVNLAGNRRINCCYYVRSNNHNDLNKFMNIIDSNCLPESGAHGSQLHEKIFLKFANYKASGEYSDYTIEAHGKQFKVHKCALAAQSTVFANIFLMEEPKDVKTFATISNFSEEAFEGFLNYFYLGDFDNSLDIIEMFQLAILFDVPELKATCTVKILEKVDESNAFDIFNLGHQHESQSLIMHAFRIIQKMFPTIPDALVNNRDHINKVIAAKRELDAVVASLA